ncbi:6-phosphofructokinase [Peptostreptococcaceae bacterium OttesenSCG-928-C18]|nr:6-phosphofructokinase [Peptostreptococcaceae bacterium OttesenSCG-928-C18]
MKTIGILTSGGDAPGMNAAIRAISRTAIFNGLRVMGIRFGYDGLINGNIYEMNVSSVADIIQRGGTMLGSARSEEFKTKKGQEISFNILKDFGIDGLVVLGGDGSFKGAEVLSNMGIKTIGLPCTIDNDMGYTDFTIGFYTAVDTVSEAISKLRDTSSSHGRANIVEVMGRHCGDIALFSGVASGAESIIVPEKELDLELITNRIKRGRKRGKLHHIIVLAEGVGKPYELKEQIKRITNVETKVTILGHIQRGGSPCPYDRLLATEMGSKAVKLLIEGRSGLAMATVGGKIVPVSLAEAVSKGRVLNEELYNMAGEISI